MVLNEQEIRDIANRVTNKVIKQIKEMDNSVMKRYYDIDGNALSPRPLNEVYVDRILNKHGANGMVIVSAHKTEADPSANNANTQSLIRDIKATGRSYIPVYGGYKSQEGQVDNYEPSFIVTNYDREGNLMDFDELVDFAIEMCDKYNQDSVLIKSPDGVPHYYNRRGQQVSKSATNNVIKNDPTQEYFTSLIKTNNMDSVNPGRSKRFTYDINFECFINPKHCTLNERMRRSKGGEIMFD